MLAHYRELGVASFSVNAHLSHSADNVIEEVRAITEDFGCGIASVTVGNWQNDQVGIYQRSRRRYPNDWFILADQDELQIYPGNLIEILNECDRKGYDYLMGCLVDRVGRDGEFLEIVPNLSIWTQFPLGGFISYPMLGAHPGKVVAAKGHVSLTRGQHQALSRRGCPIEEYFIQVHHFKWVKGLVDRLAQRAEMLKNSKTSHWIESQRFVSYYYANNGRIDVSDPRFRVLACDREYGDWDCIRRLAINFRDHGMFPVTI